MKNRILFAATIALLFAALPSARADDALEALKRELVANYSAIAGHSSADAHARAVELKEAAAAFTAAPSKETQDKAKDAWIAARLPYLQSQVFRATDSGGASLDAARVETLTKAEEKPGGFHVIEFLLWGQDESVDRPGERPYEEFIKGKGEDAARFAELLNASAGLVESTTAAYAADWDSDSPDNSRAALAAMPTGEALQIIFGNVAELAGKTLRVDRLEIPYKSREQADESSNFSDTTHLDLIYTCSGIANVVAGAYVGNDKQAKVQGTGILKLAAALDAEAGLEVKLAVNRVMLAVSSLRPPFDRALLAPDDSPAREAIKEIMDALDELTATTGELAKALGVEIGLKPGK
jgi:putative iron-regulated protein